MSYEIILDAMLFQVTYETIIFSRYQLFLIESVGVMYFMNGQISPDIHSLFIGALKVHKLTNWVT